MAANKSADEITRRLDTLPDEIQPGRDLWAGIELAIASDSEPQNVAPERRRPRWPLAVAASILAPAVLVWLLMAGKPVPDEHNGPAVVAAQLSEQFESQKEALLVAYRDQNAVTDNWQEQLSELESAAAAVKAALANDPNNHALLRMLQSVYQQQIDLIERVHAPKWQRI